MTKTEPMPQPLRRLLKSLERVLPSRSGRTLRRTLAYLMEWIRNDVLRPTRCIWWLEIRASSSCIADALPTA